MTTIYDNETVQRRLRYVLEVKHDDKAIAEAAREAGVDWHTMKRWVVWFEEDGVKGLLNKSRGRTKPIPDHAKDRIIKLKRKKRSRSARKVRDLFGAETGIHLHRQSVWRVLKEAGENRRVKGELKVYHDFERHHPNSLWQIDFMDAIVVEGVGLVYLILILDDYSRGIVGGRFVPDRSAYQALSVLWEAIEKYGMPDQIYSDQGTQFKNHLGKGYTHFEKVCHRLGIKPIFGSIGYPQGRGKIERLFEFIQNDFIPEYHFRGVDDMNEKFLPWIRWYMEKHEHSSLGGKPPASRWKGFTPRMPEGDLFEVFSEHFTRKVRKNATISFRSNIYPVDPRLIKEKVEVRVFGNEVKIYSHSKLLGEYDARINYHEKMLRQTYTRQVRKDGHIRFQNVRYPIGKEFAGRKVELVIIRGQLRAFLSSNRMLIFKLGEGDAVLVRLGGVL